MTSTASGPTYGTERVSLGESSVPEGWWTTYEAVLERSGLGAVSRKAIHDDSEFIVSRCVLGAGPPGDARWAPSRERRGVVMGAVQSGKTASMLAVAAMAMDRGVDAVVILAGTRTALWLQTWERVLAQLDSDEAPLTRWMFVPTLDPNDVGSGPLFVDSLYGVTDQLAERALSQHRPFVAVVMKQVAHLERMSRTLHEVFYPLAEERARALHLLVIDDEADDSSISDTDLVSSASAQERQVPRRIVDLWESRQRKGETAIPQLHATYVAYTATPQANFLQDERNPLAPTDFVVSLRTPGAEGDVASRTPTYRVPEGLPAWYTGGDIFYKTLARASLCVPTNFVPEEARLPHALRGFLLASAIRLDRHTGAVGPRQAATRRFGSRAEAKTVSGPVMSMLVHPSPAKHAHFLAAGQILAWSAGVEADKGQLLLSEGQRLLRSEGVEADMREFPEKWKEWIDSYGASARVVAGLPGAVNASLGAGAERWAHLRQLILEEVVPGTGVAVINSDENADVRPVFEPVPDGDKWRSAPNLCTIFVSGNVMSRGLTLEGLSTTLFTRVSDDPAADTQMQMQRWFGYRGPYIDVCRVLMSQGQISLFTQYHETDEALRRQVLAGMSTVAPARPSVLQGRSFRATAKIRGVRGLPLSPGHEPFMTYVNDPKDDLENQVLVAELFRSGRSGVPDSGARQGLLLERSLTLLETADLLGQLRYPCQGQRQHDGRASGWEAVEKHAGLGPTDPMYPLYRVPVDSDPVPGGAASPYNVAAYLRFWAACLERRVPGAVTTDEPPVMWSLVDLASRAATQPRFRVGLRFGPGEEVTAGPLSDISCIVRPMEREIDGSFVMSGWGSRNYRDGVLWGDEFFDCYPSGRLPSLTPSGARALGSDGLVLFHVLAHRGGFSLAPAVSIPVGGPDQIHATVARSGHDG